MLTMYATSSRDEEVKHDWSKNGLANFPLHKLCCSKDPKFNETTIIPTKQQCLSKDLHGNTPLIYLITNKTADYDAIEQIVKIGGKESLFLEDREGWNALYRAWEVGDQAIQRLLVRIGGRELVDTRSVSVGAFVRSRRLRLISEIQIKEDIERLREFRSSNIINSALLLHDYINALQFGTNLNLDKLMNNLLETKPSYREVNDIILNCGNIPQDHLQKLKQYKNDFFEKELESFTESQEKIPLMRSTITVVGRGRDGKTTTINSLKGLPFQPFCESTKGAQTSEVDIHEVGIHVTNAEASRSSSVKFKEAERDPYSTKRSVAKQLLHTKRAMDLTLAKTKKADNKGISFRCCIQKSFIPRFTRRIKPNLHQNQNITNPITPSANYEEEEDIRKKKGNISLDNADGKSIRFTIYDNGGQRVFRSIQNILLSREGIFIVVFNMMNLIEDDRSRQREALEHLQYWLSSIKTDACKEASDESTNPSEKYPPVILVGTHFDYLLASEEDIEVTLKALDELLSKELDNLQVLNLTKTSHDTLIEGRKRLYNTAQDLCFWSVDNSNPNDANIQTIRKVLLQAAIEDPGFDVFREVPISFLQAMDKLTLLSEEVPVIPIQSKDPSEHSVIDIMRSCSVFDAFQNSNEMELNICKAVLKQYHNIGHFIYFDQMGLEEYCILDPQWLINMITYIVRDFKLHRFHRDFKAMALNNGKPWKDLLNRGLLHGHLLRKLWLDREHEVFLTKLMLKLGIFGQLHDNPRDPSKNVYTVPTAITISSKEAIRLSMPKVRDYLDICSQDEASRETIDMSNCSFNLVPCYGRLINRLITEWSNGYDLEDKLPVLLPCAANLCLGKDYKFSIFVNEAVDSLEVYCADENKIDVIMKYIADAYNFVNRNMYQNRLRVGMTLRKVEQVVYRNANFRQEKIMVSGIDSKETTSQNPNLRALLEFSISEKLARIIHENDEDMTPEELIELYYVDKEIFENEMLPELGISKKIDKARIIKLLAKQPEPLEEEYYAIFNFLNEDELEAVKEEENAIITKLRLSCFKSTIYKGHHFHKIHTELRRNQEYKIVHFAMHGGSIDGPKLASCLQKSSVKCAFLNTCESETVAMHLRDNSCLENVAYWKSKVEDNAAKSFAEAFYEYLSLNRRQNYLKFDEAFQFAKEHIELRNYLLIDPIADSDELERKKREVARPDLVAAGIPGFYDKSKKEKDEANPQAITDPNDCKVMISFNNASAGKDAQELCHFLNRHGTKTFCTRVFCPNNIGNWREYTVVGANKCKVFITLMTDGWQKSNECQYETDIVKTRLARKRVHIIPVYYSSFDYDFDEDNNHFYGTSWASYQGIPSKESDDKWMESILKLCQGALE